MKKMFISKCIGLIAVVCLFAMSASGSTLARILETGVLRVGIIEQDDPPFVVTTPEGTLAGYDIDMCRDIAEKMGVDIQFVREAQTYDDLIPLVLNDRADILVSDFSCTLSRAKRILFSKPYTITPHAFLANTVWYAKIRKHNAKLQQLANSPEYVVGIVQSTANEQKLRSLLPEVQVKGFATTAELGQALVMGHITMAFGTTIDTALIKRAHPNKALLMHEEILPTIVDRVAIGLAADAFHLKFWLDEYIDARPAGSQLDPAL